MSMTVLGAIIQFNPLGPHGLWPRLLHAVTLTSALAVGIGWIICSWPPRRWAIAFVLWADAAIAVGASVCSAPASQLGATNHMALIGVFAAFLLGWRVLAVHCTIAFVVITAITLWNVNTGTATLAELYVYNAPAYSNVIFLPIVIQAVIENARIGLQRTAFAAHRDPLTGLLNRRGIQSAIDTKMVQSSPPGIMLVIAVDIDNFKEINDTHGHDAGDQVLQALADTLTTNIRSQDIAARTGGDEFLVVAFLHSTADIDHIVQRIHALSLPAHPTVSISVGFAWQYTDHSNFTFRSLTRQADCNLYETKHANHLHRISDGLRTSAKSE